MATKSFTTSSVKTLSKYSSIFGRCNIMVLIRTKFYQTKVTKMIKNYVQSNKIHQRSIRIKISSFYYGKRKSRNWKFKKSKAFIDHSQTIDDVYENLEDYNSTKKKKMLIVFDDIIADMESNKVLSYIVIQLLLKGRKLNISFVFNL